MPTVARIQGGKEWEASLSRRIARTRRLSRSKKGRESCNPGFGPLFPGKGSGKGISDVGLGSVRDFKAKWTMSRWGSWGVVGVAALVVAVGLGFWARSKGRL